MNRVFKYVVAARGPLSDDDVNKCVGALEAARARVLLLPWRRLPDQEIPEDALETVHENRRDHVCGYCKGVAFGTASTLKKHIEVVHLTIKRSRGAK